MFGVKKQKKRRDQKQIEVIFVTHFGDSGELSISMPSDINETFCSFFIRLKAPFAILSICVIKNSIVLDIPLLLVSIRSIRTKRKTFR